MSDETARAALDEAARAALTGGEVVVSPSVHEVSTQRLFDIASHVRDSEGSPYRHLLIVWRESGGLTLQCGPAPTPAEDSEDLRNQVRRASDARVDADDDQPPRETVDL